MTKTALVTGASRGIGLGIAQRLACLGYSLTVTARDPQHLASVATDLTVLGAPDVLAIAGDLSNPEHLERLTTGHEKNHGPMSALILNAGIGTAGSIAELPINRFDKMVAVNFRAPFQLLQQSLPLLRSGAVANPDRGAKVIVLASITGVFAERGLAAYGATKAALISLTQALNAEESGNGVSATTIAPGFVDTDMSKWTHDRIPPNEMLEVNDIVEIAAAILQLSSRAVIPNIVMTRAGTDGYGA